MEVVSKDSKLWEYLTPELRGLISDGEKLINSVEAAINMIGITDYSFLVFPFSKAYEGFLKKIFLEMNLIDQKSYYGDKIRIGRILNPYFKHESENVFERFCSHKKGGSKISQHLWNVWTRSRNKVFHYFPNNFRRLSYDEAVDMVLEVVKAMEMAVDNCAL